MPENCTNTRVMKALRGYHPIRVENVACAGTPDVECQLGWIENKHIPRWPVRAGIVRVDHFSPQQRVWHILRSRAGGKSWVFMQVGREYILFKGDVAAEHLGKVEESRLKQLALGYWPNGLNDQEFILALKGHWPKE